MLSFGLQQNQGLKDDKWALLIKNLQTSSHQYKLKNTLRNLQKLIQNCEEAHNTLYENWKKEEKTFNNKLNQLIDYQLIAMDGCLNWLDFNKKQYDENNQEARLYEIWVQSISTAEELFRTLNINCLLMEKEIDLTSFANRLKIHTADLEQKEGSSPNPFTIMSVALKLKEESETKADIRKISSKLALSLGSCQDLSPLSDSPMAGIATPQAKTLTPKKSHTVGASKHFRTFSAPLLPKESTNTNESDCCKFLLCFGRKNS